MTTVPAPSLMVCPNCRAQYRWKPELAGKPVKCKCGTVFKPQAAESAPPSPVQEPAHSAAAPTVPATPKFGTLATAIGGTSAIQRALDAREDEVQPSGTRDRSGPIIVLVAGVLIEILLLMILVPGKLFAVAVIGIAVVVQALIFAPVLVGALTLAAKWFDLNLGGVAPFIFKVLALTLGAGAVADVVYMYVMFTADFDTWLIAAGYVVYVILCGIPMAYFFEMGLPETATAVTITYVPRLAAMFGLMAVAPHLFH